MQWVNSAFNVYDKVTGVKVAVALNGNQFWAGFGGGRQTHSDGDPIIKYDQLVDADRQFQVHRSARCAGGVGTLPRGVNATA